MVHTGRLALGRTEKEMTGRPGAQGGLEFQEKCELYLSGNGETWMLLQRE